MDIFYHFFLILRGAFKQFCPETDIPSDAIRLAVLQAFLAYHWRKKANGTVVLGNRKATHRRLGIMTLILWYFSFLTGIIIYAILYVL